MHQNSRFEDIVEEIKYGLKEGIIFDYKNIAKVSIKYYFHPLFFLGF